MGITWVSMSRACITRWACAMCQPQTHPPEQQRSCFFFLLLFAKKKKEERRVSLPCGTIIIMRAHFTVILSIFDLLMQCIHIIFDEFPKLLPILLFYDSEYAYTMQGPRNSEKVEHPPNTHWTHARNKWRKNKNKAKHCLCLSLY